MTFPSVLLNLVVILPALGFVSTIIAGILYRRKVKVPSLETVGTLFTLLIAFGASTILFGSLLFS